MRPRLPRGSEPRICKLEVQPRRSARAGIEHGSIRYYYKPGVDRLIRVDYHGAKEVPTGTCRAILESAGLNKEETS